MKKFISPLFCAVLFFAACNDETTTVSATSDAEKVTAFKDLDDCDSTIVGKLVYVKDSVKVFACTDEGWAAMSGAVVENGSEGSDGKDGKDGNDGKDGKNGKNGKDGSDGKDGVSCTVKAIEGGYKVLCGGDSVGVLLNGVKGDSGAQGIQGIQGVKGEDGKSAYELSGYEGSPDKWIESLKGENGTNCNIESDSNGEVVIKCGDKETTLYKAMCGTTPYDPAEKFCDNRDYQTYKYKTISVGNYSEIWMAENLNYATPVNGSDSSSFCYGDGVEGVTDRGAENCAKYGRLYTWAAAVGKSEEDCGYEKDCDLGEGDIQGVCPEGWHLPSKAEWEALIVAVDGSIESYESTNVAGKKLKSATEWTKDGSVSNDDTYSFAALPAGHYDGDNFGGEEDNSSFWSSTQDSGRDAYNADLNYYNDYARLYYPDKNYGFSVRCIKD